MTFEYYFNRIMNVLPKIRQTWSRTLKVFYICTTLLLVAASTVDCVRKFNAHDLAAQACAELTYTLILTLIVLSLIAFALLSCKLRRKLDEIEHISELDTQILWKYERLLSQLNSIIGVQLIVQVFQTCAPRLFYAFTDNCDIQTKSSFLDAAIFYIVHPSCDSVQILVYLYIFWRKKLSNQAQLFMAMGTEGMLKTSGALPDAMRNS